MRPILALMLLFALAACKEEEQASDQPIRGLETHLIADVERTTVRRFSAVLEPTSLNTLSFEVAGKLNAVPLEVGQRVQQGQTLLTLDTTSFQIQLDNAEAGIVASRAARDTAVETFERQEQLLERGTVTKVVRDAAETEAIAAEARLEQAIKARDNAQETLSRASIVSPVDGTIKSGQIGIQPDRPEGPGAARVYVYDDASGTVMEREVAIAGVRENAMIVIEGLAVGDRVASAGVPFLRDGMQVNLLADGE